MPLSPLTGQALVNLSPLPLPIPLLLYLGVYDLSDSKIDGLQQLRDAVSRWWENDVNLFEAAKSMRNSQTIPKPAKVIKVTWETYDALARGSVDACREIWSHAMFLRSTTSEQKNERWKTDLSMASISRISEFLEAVMERQGLGIRLFPGGAEGTPQIGTL